MLNCKVPVPVLVMALAVDVDPFAITPVTVVLPFPAKVNVRLVALFDILMLPNVSVPAVKLFVIVLLLVLVKVFVKVMLLLPEKLLLLFNVNAFAKVLPPPMALRLPPFRLIAPVPSAVLVAASIVPWVSVVVPP